MAKTKTAAPPPLPKSYYKGEYDWAPDELLDECSLLNSVEDVVSRVRPGMPVCADSRDTGGCPFFFLYQIDVIPIATWNKILDTLRNHLELENIEALS